MWHRHSCQYFWVLFSAYSALSANSALILTPTIFYFPISNLTPAPRHPPPAPPESSLPVSPLRARCTIAPRATPQSSTAPAPPLLPNPKSKESDPPTATTPPARGAMVHRAR